MLVIFLLISDRHNEREDFLLLVCGGIISPSWQEDMVEFVAVESCLWGSCYGVDTRKQREELGQKLPDYSSPGMQPNHPLPPA